MGKCLKEKDESKPKTGSYKCEKCGAVAEKKDHLCKPHKVEGEKCSKGTGSRQGACPLRGPKKTGVKGERHHLTTPNGVCPCFFPLP